MTSSQDTRSVKVSRQTCWPNPLAEEAVAALGVVVCPMVAFEADDALASAATSLPKRSRRRPGRHMLPDKDFAQVVSGTQVICWDRRRGLMLTKRRCWRNSSSARLHSIGSPSSAMPLTATPDFGWGPNDRGARVTNTSSPFPKTMADGVWDAPGFRLAERLRAHQADALLYRRLATLRRDVPLHEGPISSGRVRRID